MTQQLPAGLTINRPATSEGGLPEGLSLNSPATERDDTPPEAQDQKGIFESFSEWFSGQDRSTPQLEQLPTIIESGFLEGASVADIAKIAPMVALTNDPNEIANIIQKTIPEVRVQYDKDAKGNIYPVLVNPNNGKTAIVDRPGADLMNAGQFITQAATFSIGGPTGGIVKTAAAEAGKEALIQGAQAAAGGDFDAGDVVASGVLGGGSEALQKGAGFGFRALKGRADELTSGILSAADEFNVPVMTSDIHNPSNWFQRGLQITSEWLPVVGTGGLRHSQQEAREQALEDFVSMYRGGTYEEVVDGVSRQNKELKQAAGDVYNKVNPYLDQISQEGGIPLPKAQKELNDLAEYLTTPGREVEDSALNLLDDLDEAFNGGYQSFQVVKDNIGAWQSKMEGLDPKTKINDSNVTRKFKSVLRALRDDRDSFARANLNDADYAALKKADQSWQSVIEDMSTNKLKAVLEKGEATPEVVRGMLFSRNKSDINRLYKSLDERGKASARAAFITEIANDLAKTQKGLSPTSFATALNKYQDGIDVLFQGQRKDEINGFINLMKATARAQEVERGAGSQTFERLAGLGAIGATGGAFTGAVPPEALAAYASIGGLSRLFESPRMRNLLIKANGLEPGSTQMQQIGAQVNRLLLASLQANPLKGTTEFEKELSEELRSQRAEPEGIE